ncbi:hypothetical protein QM334_17670 [Burkholderia cenocepacia]|nr:hypothetical protein [Burkholderia cenocepacia]
MPLVIGSHFRPAAAAEGAPAVAFTARAMNRDGYGNLCEFVSLGRVHGQAGSYRLAPLDLDHPEALDTHQRNCPTASRSCRPTSRPTSSASTRRLNGSRAFGASVALTLHARAMDDITQASSNASPRDGVPVVATNWLLMHVRSRKPLQGVLTEIRGRRPVSECAYELAANAEGYLRLRLACPPLSRRRDRGKPARRSALSRR